MLHASAVHQRGPAERARQIENRWHKLGLSPPAIEEVSATNAGRSLFDVVDPGVGENPPSLARRVLPNSRINNIKQEGENQPPLFCTDPCRVPPTGIEPYHLQFLYDDEAETQFPYFRQYLDDEAEAMGLSAEEILPLLHFPEGVSEEQVRASVVKGEAGCEEEARASVVKGEAGAAPGGTRVCGANKHVIQNSGTNCQLVTKICRELSGHSSMSESGCNELCGSFQEMQRTNVGEETQRVGRGICPRVAFPFYSHDIFTSSRGMPARQIRPRRHPRRPRRHPRGTLPRTHIPQMGM